MATIAEITRALNVATTAGRMRAAMGEALRALGSTYRLPELSQRVVNDLDRARKPLEAEYRTLAARPNATELGADRARLANLVTRAYVEIAGAQGESQSKIAVSFGDELVRAAKEAPALIGDTLGQVAAGAGGVAGGLVGALLKQVWPLLVLVALVALIAGRVKREVLA